MASLWSRASRLMAWIRWGSEPILTTVKSATSATWPRRRHPNLVSLLAKRRTGGTNWTRWITPLSLSSIRGTESNMSTTILTDSRRTKAVFSQLQIISKQVHSIPKLLHRQTRIRRSWRQVHMVMIETPTAIIEATPKLSLLMMALLFQSWNLKRSSFKQWATLILAWIRTRSTRPLNTSWKTSTVSMSLRRSTLPWTTRERRSCNISKTKEMRIWKMETSTWWHRKLLLTWAGPIFSSSLAMTPVVIAATFTFHNSTLKRSWARSHQQAKEEWRTAPTTTWCRTIILKAPHSRAFTSTGFLDPLRTSAKQIDHILIRSAMRQSMYWIQTMWIRPFRIINRRKRPWTFVKRIWTMLRCKIFLIMRPSQINKPSSTKRTTSRVREGTWAMLDRIWSRYIKIKMETQPSIILQATEPDKQKMTSKGDLFSSSQCKKPTSSPGRRIQKPLVKASNPASTGRTQWYLLRRITRSASPSRQQQRQVNENTCLQIKLPNSHAYHHK